MSVVVPKEPYYSDPKLLLALCIWREARGEPVLSKLGVAYTIMNRCIEAPREGFKHTIRDNILKPWAFTSFMENDINSNKYPGKDDSVWCDCLAVAGLYMEDPTMGAVFYHALKVKDPAIQYPKQWGKVIHTVTIGKTHFYALA